MRDGREAEGHQKRRCLSEHRSDVSTSREGRRERGGAKYGSSEGKGEKHRRISLSSRVVDVKLALLEGDA